MHSNLAFPLLKKLSEVGDPVARQRFKEEIIRRFTSGNENVQIFLYAEKYLSYLDEDMFLENVLNAEEANSMIELKLKSRLRYKFVINFNDDEVRKRIFLEPLYYSIKNGHIDELEIDLYQFNFSLPDLLLRFSKLRSLTIFSKSHLEKILEFNIELKTINTLTIKVEGNIKIPNLFQNFPNVSDLFINGDDIARFEEIPESIGQLEHLEWLEINFIPLKKIPNSFKKLKNLEWLTLNNANLEKIPDKNDFKNLETLYIDGFFL